MKIFMYSLERDRRGKKVFVVFDLLSLSLSLTKMSLVIGMGEEK